MVNILRRIRRKNFYIVKQIAILSNQITQQTKQFDREVIEQYVNQLLIPQQMDRNVSLACE